MTGTDWLQFLSYSTWVGVLFLVSGLVVVVVTVLVERRRARSDPALTDSLRPFQLSRTKPSLTI